MAKITVIKEPDGERSPFLRGILVQSLVNAGLAFDEAYALARVMRQELQDRQEITNTELRGRVAVMLEEHHGNDKRRAYETRPGNEPAIIIHTPARSTPFSVGIMAHSLEACSIPPEMAMRGARMVHATLRKAGHREIDHKALRRIIFRCLCDHCSREVADRYLSWRRFENSGIPMIILIGGATGSGKSAVSAELAYRLDISRHQSTDMMREIIRSYLSPQMIPTLGYSSFDAWRGLPGSDGAVKPAVENPVVTGFLSQLGAMKLALQATIDRAIQERHDLILEGVHVVPTEMSLDAMENNQAVVIPIILASMKKELLRRQLGRGGSEKDMRKVEHQMEYLDDIWELQAWLLDQADRNGTRIIENWYLDDTVRAVLEHVIDVVMKYFPPQPDDQVWEA